MLQPNRHKDSKSYRYGFQGQEKDDEIKGEGNSYTTPFRQYDSRLGRWLTLDPLMAKYAGQSPYAAFNNNPVFFADPTGLEGDPPKTIKNKEGKVVDPNGNGSDFADDWYAAVDGNLVMTNGTDYQVWNQKSGKYEVGRAPKEHNVTAQSYDERKKNGAYAHFAEIEGLQVGDVISEHLISTMAPTPSDHQEFTYLGEGNLALTKEFSSVTSANYAGWLFPIGGGTKGGSLLLKFLSRSKIGVGIIKITPKLCFTGGTLVDTDSGLKKIEEVIIGDRVWSFNEETEQIELKQVVTLFKNSSEELIEISIQNDKITCTLEHPFFVENKWVEAKNLKIGDKLSSKDGSSFEITSLKKNQKEVKTYNFEVEGNHNYYVSRLRILVHNNCFGFNIKKAVNSNMPHAVERSLERGIFQTVDEAKSALNMVKDYISKNKAFPSGSLKDPSYIDRVLVPVGNKGVASYQVAKNGTAKLKTVLNAK